MENFLPFSSILKLSSENTFNLEDSKICRLGKVKDEHTFRDDAPTYRQQYTLMITDHES